MSSSQLTHIFQRGRSTTKQYFSMCHSRCVSMDIAMCHLQDMASVDPAFYDSKAGPADQRLQQHIGEGPGAPMMLRWLTFSRVAIRTRTLPTPMALYGPMIYVNFVRILWG